MKRNTSQRAAILHALESAPGPLTPQEVLDIASQEQESLGLATVYRTLKTLEARGEITPVYLPNDSTRYEPAGRGHHHHFRCETCEQVFELEASCPVTVLEGSTLAGGYKVEHHELTLYGVCPACH